MNKKHRVMTTLEHKEPDLLPITELAIDLPHLERIAQAQYAGEVSLQTPFSADRRAESDLNSLIVLVYRKLGFELVARELSTADGWVSQKNPDGTINDEWGRVLSYDSKARTWIPTGSVFTSPEHFEQFPFPDPHASGRLFAIEDMKRKVGDEIALAGLVKDPFAVAWEMFKVTNFVRWLYEKPNFIRKVIERIADFNVEMIKQLIDAKVDLIICDGDYAEKKGPLVPVSFFKEVILPNLRRQVQVAHKAGLKFIKHTDGNLNPILNELAGIVDGLHSLDPTAEMDIGDLKRRYGDRLVLMGNVSVDNLCRKTPQEIVQETKECIRTAAPCGGYVLSSSNSWYADAKLENCLTMVETGRKYGRYPINL
jgi:uroporphyrinogen decarboxylase